RCVKISQEDKHKSNQSTTVRHSTARITKLAENVNQVEDDVFTSLVSDEESQTLVVDRETPLEQSPEDILPSKPCRIITVSHLSPNVAKLLGSKFNISADFFNRHLPGTEAISGRLISRLSLSSSD